MLGKVLLTHLPDVDFFEAAPGWDSHPQNVTLRVHLELDHVIEALEEAAITLMDLVSENLLDERQLRVMKLHERDGL